MPTFEEAREELNAAILEKKAAYEAYDDADNINHELGTRAYQWYQESCRRVARARITLHSLLMPPVEPLVPEREEGVPATLEEIGFAFLMPFSGDLLGNIANY